MSRSVFDGSYQVSPFIESLGTVGDMGGPSAGATGYRTQSPVKSAFEQAKKEGYEAGYTEGVLQGRAEVEAAHALALSEFRDRLRDFVAKTEGAIDNWYAKSEEALSTLAIDIARKAICCELAASRESVLDITKEALAEIRNGTEVRIRVNPSDVGVLESRRQELLEAISGVRNLEIVSDRSIGAGCEIDTPSGTIDATVVTYLNRLTLEAA